MTESTVIQRHRTCLNLMNAVGRIGAKFIPCSILIWTDGKQTGGIETEGTACKSRLALMFSNRSIPWLNPHQRFCCRSAEIDRDCEHKTIPGEGRIGSTRHLVIVFDFG